MEFRDLKEAVSKQFSTMKDKSLFRTAATKDEMWETYLSSFPEGTNPVYKERTEHDCTACKQFIRAIGNMVALVDGQMVSLWDCQVGGFYQPVVDAMSALVKAKPIQNIFLHNERSAGVDENHQQLDSGEVVTWGHLHAKLPKKLVNKDPGTTLSKARSTMEVMHRGLTEITDEAIETTLEVLGSVYRGEEHRSSVKRFQTLKQLFDGTENFCWLLLDMPQSITRIRNTSIGTLLVDLSEGMELEQAVQKFEAIVAPQNYKRPKALITKGMIRKAQEKIAELGFTEALGRRYAVAEDLTINNVIFANRASRKRMDVFDEMTAEVPIKTPDRVEEMTIEAFLSDIVPGSEAIEVLLENQHVGNMVSLIAPEDPAAKGMFKWGNNFSWAYAGEVADSMKARVKQAGGDVDGALRYSIRWNDDGDNQNDFDAHCLEPNSNLIHFPNKGQRHPSTGMLDVDIVRPGSKVAVENITWADEDRMQEGVYVFLVHNYSHNGGRRGFSAEIEYDGHIYSYEYDKELRQGEKVPVARLEYTRKGGIKILESLPSTKASKECWGVKTHVYQNVSMIMHSPNHWDGECTGNKHYFFMLEGCAQEGQARGFFNEFLTDDLREHRKVFEVLGSKMRTEPSDNQLSGLGFTRDYKGTIVVRVTGATTNHMLKLRFRP